MKAMTKDQKETAQAFAELNRKRNFAATQRRMRKIARKVLRGSPDAEERMRPDKRGASEAKPCGDKSTDRPDFTHGFAARQAPVMTHEEIRALALSLYPEAIADPQGRKHIQELHRLASVAAPDVVVECCYYLGCWHALEVMRSRLTRI